MPSKAGTPRKPRTPKKTQDASPSLPIIPEPTVTPLNWSPGLDIGSTGQANDHAFNSFNQQYRSNRQYPQAQQSSISGIMNSQTQQSTINNPSTPHRQQSFPQYVTSFDGAAGQHTFAQQQNLYGNIQPQATQSDLAKVIGGIVSESVLYHDREITMYTIRSSENFQRLRQLAQRRQGVLQPFQQMLAKANPRLTRFLNEHVDDFRQFLSESDEAQMSTQFSPYVPQDHRSNYSQVENARSQAHNSTMPALESSESEFFDFNSFPSNGNQPLQQASQPLLDPATVETSSDRPLQIGDEVHLADPSGNDPSGRVTYTLDGVDANNPYFVFITPIQRTIRIPHSTLFRAPIPHDGQVTIYQAHVHTVNGKQEVKVEQADFGVVKRRTIADSQRKYDVESMSEEGRVWQNLSEEEVAPG